MAKKALILLNMGGPNNLNEVELFLKNMFSDKNIITTKSPILRAMIAFFITTLRLKEATKNYEILGGKSPIVGHTEKLVNKLKTSLLGWQVDFAMRYTPPFCDKVIQELVKNEVEEVYLLPLYPHYSTTTTKSSLEDFEKYAKEFGLKANIYAFESFYNDGLYNSLILQTIKDALQNEDASKIDLLFSAHSLPQKMIDRGDVYQKEIIEHVEILTKKLHDEGIHFKNIHLSYQSKLGPLKWLEPSTHDKLISLENKDVLIVPISFVIDNSETDFELSIDYAKVAQERNFRGYRVAKCLNDNDDFVKWIVDFVNR